MAKKTKADSVLLEIKLAEVDPNHYCPRHADVSCLSALQGGMLARVTLALQAGGASLRNGRQVRNWNDAIRYILEKIGEEAGYANGAP